MSKKNKEKKAVYERFCIFRNANTEEEVPAFKLNDKRHEFFLSMPAMLEMLATAAHNGSLPQFSDEWVIDVRRRYLNFNPDYSDGDFE